MVNDNHVQAAAWIVRAACQDGVKISQDEVVRCLGSDLRLAPERVLTEQECNEFVRGDSGGIVPEELRRLLPKTHTYLDSEW